MGSFRTIHLADAVVGCSSLPGISLEDEAPVLIPSRLAPQDEKDDLAQSRRDAECAVHEILPFSAPPRLGASQFGLRPEATSPGIERIYHP